MRKGIIITLVVLVIVLGVIAVVMTWDSAGEEGEGYNEGMKITSSVFPDGGSIPSKYTCDGEGISPPLSISEVPEGARTLVLVMDDPDVPRNLKPDGMWDHWLVWNIPVSVTDIAEGREPEGVIGRNTGGQEGYQGPCPPDREHRYFFKLYALDTALDLDPQSTGKGDLEQAMKGHILSEAMLTGRYVRQ